MIELYNALKFIAMLFFIQKILTFNLGVAFLKSVSICTPVACYAVEGGWTITCKNEKDPIKNIR